MNHSFLSIRHGNSTVPKERPRLSIGHFFLYLLFVLVLAFGLYLPRSKSVPFLKDHLGESSSADIIMKNDLEVRDPEKTELARQKALERFTPLYEFDGQRISYTQALLHNWFTQFHKWRQAFFAKQKNSAAIQKEMENGFNIAIAPDEAALLLRLNTFGKFSVNELLEAIAQWQEQGILISKVGVKRDNAGFITLLAENQASGRTVKLDDLLDLQDLDGQILAFTKKYSLSAVEQRLIGFFFREWIGSNIAFAKERNDAQIKKLLAEVGPVYVHLKKGTVILHQNEIITPAHIRLIRLIREEENRISGRTSNLAFIIVLVLLQFLFLWAFQKRVAIGGMNQKKLVPVLAATVLVSVFAYRIFLFLLPLMVGNINFGFEPDNQAIWYAIPFHVAPLVIVFLFDLHSGFIFSFVTALLAGMMGNWDLNVVMYTLLGSLAVVFAVEHFQRLKRSSILKAGFLWLLPMNLFFVIMLSLAHLQQGWRQFSFYLVMGFISAFLTSVVASFLIPLWESLFKLVSDLKLVELTNLNLPTFRKMLEKAPGTYHHAQMVATLAESAAQAVGLSPLLLRAMALYHDVGKVENPQFFTENHSLYEDPHEHISPRESARFIIAHISNGLDIAEKLKLPALIGDAILQHHGTKLVKFFYEKAKASSAGDLDEFNESSFRYPGKKPQNIENAIIMLADQMEAATKSLSAPNDEEIRNVIEEIINSDIAEDQFSECSGLTFQNLRIIADCFFSKFNSIYHQRVAYPGFDFHREKNHDQSH